MLDEHEQWILAWAALVILSIAVAIVTILWVG